MSYYAITPFAQESERSLNETIEEEDLENTVKKAYQEIISNTQLYDFSVKSNHEDIVFIFSSLVDFQAAASVLEQKHIPYQTSIVDEVSQGESDLLTSNRKFRTIKVGEPDMNGLDNLELGKTYESE
jgi:nicotinamide riboside kinase